MAHVPACPRIKVTKVMNLLPIKYIQALEHNQQITSCCRHPENHEIEAIYSCEEQANTKVPDIYIFHCTCGRKHRRLCAGENDIRPFWEVH